MPQYPYEYSEKEQKLIEELNYQSPAMNPCNAPTMLYNWLAIECFRTNRQDNVAESVRRCLLAMEASTRTDTANLILRLTTEFDDLIILKGMWKENPLSLEGGMNLHIDKLEYYIIIVVLFEK